MAFDPTELASDQEAQQRITAAGAPTEFAKGPEQDGVRVAGIGRLVDLLNRLDAGVVPPKPPRVKSTTAGQAGVLTPGQLDAIPEVDPAALSGMVAPRMPTPQEVGLVPDQGAFSETATKRALAGQVLSPEGVAEFERRGLKTPRIGEEPPTDVLEGAQSALADEAAEAEASAVDINDLAQKAMKADAKGFSAETALVSEEAADAILTRVQVKDQNILSLQEGGDFNFDYVDTADDVKAMITAVGERYKGETNARTRGKIPNNVTIQNAEKIFLDEIGFTRKLLNRQIGEGALSAEEFLAAREILVKSADTLTKLAEQIKSGTAGADVKLRFRRQLSIHSGIQLQLKGAQTEAARALQSFQIRVDGELDAARFGEEAQRLLSETGADQSTDALASALLKTANENGLAGINRVAEVGWGAKTKNAVHQAYLAGLLSSPATQMKNIVGTTSFMLFQLPTEIMAGMYGSIARGIKRPFGQTHAPISEDQAYMEDALLRVKGWSDAYRDALKAGSIAWRTEMPAGATKLDIERYSPSVSQGDSFFGRSIDELGKRMRIPFRLLLAADEFTKTISQRGEFYTQINRRYQHSLRKGMSEEDALDEAGMMLLDPSSVADDLITQAKFDTLQSDLGAFGDTAGKLQRTLLGRFIMPFVTAPTNAVLRTMEYVPGMPSKSIVDLTGKNGNRARQLALGRYTVGGAVMAQTAQFAMDGKITGSMPNDKASREALPPGWQPYSFVLKAEGFPEGMSLYNSFGAPNGPLIYVSFSGFEPVGGLLAITADTVQRANKTNDPELRENYAQAAILATMDYYKELPMLQGVADVVSFLDGYDAAKLSRSYAESSTLAGVPNPVSSLQRMFARLADPTRVRPREDFEYYTLDEVEKIVVDADGKRTFAYPLPDGTPNYAIVGSQKGGTTEVLMEYFQEMNALQSKDSFIRNERDLNAVVYDTFGNAKGSDEYSFAANPVAAVFSNVSGLRLKRGEKLESYEKELIRLQAMTNKWPLTNPEKMGQIKLSYGMQSDLINLAKNEIELSIEGYGALTFRNALELFTSNRDYQEMDDSAKVDYLRGINKKYIQAGFEALLENPEYANMRQAYEQVEQLKQEGLR
tara:strand:+ start:7182 stop:10490 length:3309 start_codon:yes stop_codon:yes gene_type:complete